MTRILAATLAAILLWGALEPAACATAPAAGPFPEVPLETPPRHTHLWAYVSLALGAGLVAGSFEFAERANRAYDRYNEATDPDRIESLYDETVHYDRLSSGALIAGEILLATGLYLRFLRPPPGARLQLSAGPSRCAIAWRF